MTDNAAHALFKGIIGAHFAAARIHDRDEITYRGWNILYSPVDCGWYAEKPGIFDDPESQRVLLTPQEVREWIDDYEDDHADDADAIGDRLRDLADDAKDRAKEGR